MICVLILRPDVLQAQIKELEKKIGDLTEAETVTLLSHHL